MAAACVVAPRWIGRPHTDTASPHRQCVVLIGPACDLGSPLMATRLPAGAWPESVIGTPHCTDCVEDCCRCVDVRYSMVDHRNGVRIAAPQRAAHPPVVGVRCDVAEMGTVVVRQVRSAAGEKPKTRGTLRALGLHGVGSARAHLSGPDLEGMLHRVEHLVEVDQAPPGSIEYLTPALPRRRGAPKRAGKYDVHAGGSGEIRVTDVGNAWRYEHRGDLIVVGWIPAPGIRRHAVLAALYSQGENRARVTVIKSNELHSLLWHQAPPNYLLESAENVQLLRVQGPGLIITWERSPHTTSDGEVIVALTPSRIASAVAASQRTATADVARAIVLMQETEHSE